MIAVAASFTGQPLERSLRFWVDRLGWTDEIAFAPYNQIFQQLADPGGLFLSGRSAANVILVRHEDWLRFGTAGEQVLRQRTTELVAAIRQASSRTTTPFVIAVCPASPECGPHEALDREIEQAFSGEPGVHVIDGRALLARYRCVDFHDAHTDALAHIPYSVEYFGILGTAVARLLYALRAAPRKVIALDADGTLWSGILGEDGPEGVVIDAGRRRLQELMAAKRRDGFLLCLCSRNDEAELLAFLDDPRMVLRRDDFAAWRINWQPKSQNLEELARELNLGLDSFVFLDDDGLQCAEVRARCPEVTTVRLPDDQIPQFLEHVWAFDKPTVTAEDRVRADQARREREREQVRGRALTLADFLAGLELRVDLAEAGEADLARVSQLTQRTNQLNLTTIRRSEPELRRLLDEGLRCSCVRVSDRFGDYGLVGAALHRKTGSWLDVDTFVLSCRALGRGVEHRMVAWLGEIAAREGAEGVRLLFRPTAKNLPACEFLAAAFGRHAHPIDGGIEYLVPAAVASSIDAAAAPLQTYIPAKPSTPPQNTRADSELIELIAGLGTGRALAECMSERPRTAVATTYRDEIEATVAELLGEQLEAAPVPPDANFYELGGDSLRGIQALARIRDIFDVELPIDVLYADFCCAANLADQVRALRAVAA